MNFNYFLKGDISGIQEFIFNVKSEKAARVLKARSIFVQALAEAAAFMIKDTFGENKVALLYNGGGTFFFSLAVASDGFTQKIQQIERSLNFLSFRQDLQVSLSHVGIKADDTFTDYWKRVAHQSTKDKLSKYRFSDLTPLVLRNEEAEDSVFDFFAPFDFREEGDFSDEDEDKDGMYEKWELMARFIPKGKIDQRFKHFPVGDTLNIADQQKLVATKAFQFFESKLKIVWSKKFPVEADYFYKKIQNKLPVWRPELFEQYKDTINDYNKTTEYPVAAGHIIDYYFLAYFAKERTGTNKIGIVKMDVDDLGKLFKYQPNKKTAKAVSDALTDFFEKKVNDLLEIRVSNGISDNEDTHPIRFRDNIYPIFSGGDDAFFVGSWDAIFEWTKLVNDEFKKVALNIQDDIQKGYAEEGKSIPKRLTLPTTLSAGILVVEPTYPVIRFAKLAERAIGKAKENPLKNRVSIFNEVLTWKEFDEAKETAEKLKAIIIDDGEPRGILERIRKSASGFKKSQEQALQGRATGPGVANLFYYIRHSKNQKQLEKDLVKPYAQDLIRAFAEKRATNPMKYPVAARWAEFLTRKKEQNVEV